MTRQALPPLLLLLVLVLSASCTRRGLSPAELQTKLDSIRKIEEYERMKLEGIDLGRPFGEASPLQIFYDSLRLQTLPVSYSPHYLDLADQFQHVPNAVAVYMDLERSDTTQLRAMRLPRHEGSMPLLVATFDEATILDIWLYTLTDDYEVRDGLCVYDIGDTEQEHYFAITSRYEVYRNRTLYIIDSSGYLREVAADDSDDDDIRLVSPDALSQ